jgi:glycosyltransferase involved in cell wall biosynthesis
VIIGDGHLRAQLEAQARTLGLADDVLFLGTRKDPEDFYPALDIVALTSLNEGTPLTLIEALANARPIIATGVGGVVDLLGPAVSARDGYTICARGIVVESGDAEAFASGLRRLIEDAKLRQTLGESGPEFVAGNYGKDRLLADMSELYGELIQSKSIEVSDQPPKKFGVASLK